MKIQLGPKATKASSSKQASPTIASTSTRKVPMMSNSPDSKSVNHHPIKARLLVGGLKSLFGDMHDMLAELEKEGVMPKNGVDTLNDVKQAIDMTVVELRKITPACCPLGDKPHDECRECEEEEPVVARPKPKSASPTDNNDLATKVFDLLRERHEVMVAHDEDAFLVMLRSLGNSLVAAANIMERHEHVEFPATARFDNSTSWDDSVVLEWTHGYKVINLDVRDEPITMKEIDALAKQLRKGQAPTE